MTKDEEAWKRLQNLDAELSTIDDYLQLETLDEWFRVFSTRDRTLYNALVEARSRIYQASSKLYEPQLLRGLANLNYVESGDTKKYRRFICQHRTLIPEIWIPKGGLGPIGLGPGKWYVQHKIVEELLRAGKKTEDARTTD